MHNTNSKITKEVFEDLWSVRNPRMRSENNLLQKEKEKVLSEEEKGKKFKSSSNLPSHKAFFELTTARNRWLIDPNEQNKLRKTVGAFFGLSVGSYAATTWMMLSRADTIKISDPDTLASTNLNRVQEEWDSLGKHKADLVFERIKKINPYAKIYSYSKKDLKTVEEMYSSEPIPNFVVDEIDDLEGKILLRKFAKEKNIPLISAADVGDMVIVDIERYDLDPKPEPFLGRIKNPFSINFKNLSDLQKKKLIIKLVGLEKNSERMINSLFAIGQAAPSWPQLGSTAVMAGGIITSVVKKIILGESVVSGRYYVSLDEIFVKDFYAKEVKNKREMKIKELNKQIDRQ